MNDWYQLWVQTPLGRQFGGWLNTDSARALILSLALKTCPGGIFELLDKSGNPLTGFQFPFPFPFGGSK